MRRVMWALAVVVALAAMSVSAADSPMPPNIAKKLAELGRVVDPPETAKLYAPLQPSEPYFGVRIERDLKYGPAERNLLDIFMPQATASGRPVLMFVHGGAFIGGNKRRTPDSPFYDNIMLWAVKNGFIGVNMTYRLAPQFPWPAGAEDVASAVKWVSDEIAERGGDPARIYLMGHSAGAMHVASYVSHPEFYKAKNGGLKGAIMASAVYDLTAAPLNDPEKAYFGSDPSRYASESSLPGLLRTNIPLMAVSSERDLEGFVKQFELFKEAACKRPAGCARTVMLPQHNHMSEVYSINTADTRLTDQILEFVKTGK
ncbi:MAG TPA: alpha/beta hydrolase [Bradyrhizobium sp.]|uniref:alpha/beta hydrolase n=1 Tax=Bradyrhizobium sp. TaxID=376 RepID=UPI002D7E7104|nr:alpha/beta hydrolase [Bradyrhizobium sp.]HET7887747.1 alpha/beta hydrolase [Bradyrhizobium sp.]